MNIFSFDTPDGNRQYSFRTVLSEVTWVILEEVFKSHISDLIEKKIQL